MEAVGSRLDGGVDDAALKIAELGRSVARDQVELLNSIRRRRVTQQVVRNLVIVHAVQQEVVRLLAVAVDQRTASIPTGIVAVIKAAGIGGDGARRKQSKLDIIARGQRKVIVGLPR